ncbi:hypothetical protein LEN26_007382 [Aphanomyces euteiches]|nr:hypothetical protein AeMF1_021740 [Aphanomyces euteiches]KAH9132591.1 hypothetical protein LEN26_007382 [Aphanomyces euteiches]KAH9197761.1 hypothetical protein AeNC1_000276 [Aphanomyces euteiches]
MATRNPPPTPMAVLRGHVAPINSVSFVADGERSQLLLSGSADGTLKVWDLSTRREKYSIQAHSKAGILHTATQGSSIISHGRDGMIKWWDMADGDMRESRSVACGSYTFTKTHVIDENLLLVPTEHAEMIALVDLRASDLHPSIVLNGSTLKAGMCMSLAFLPSSSTLGYPCVGFEGGSVSLFDMRSVTPLLSHSITTSSLLCMDVVSSTSTLLCGSSGPELFAAVMDPSTATATSQSIYHGKKDGFSAVSNRSDARIFATAGWDHHVRVFHRTFKPLATLKYHTESVYSVHFSPDNRLLASASKDHKIALWSIYPPSNN